MQNIIKHMWISSLAIFVALSFSMQSCDNASNSNEITELTSESEPSYLFVQQAQSGSFEPMQGGDDLFLLTLNGTDELTTWFTDKPFRKTGVLQTGRMLNIFITQSSLPNAAIEIPDAKENGESEVVVFTILGFEYDEDTGTLKYEISIITGDTEVVIPRYFSSNNNRQIVDRPPLEITDDVFPSEFGKSYLFIDNLKTFEQSTTDDICIEPTPLRPKYVMGFDANGNVIETFDPCCAINTPAEANCHGPPTCQKTSCPDINGVGFGCGPNKLCKDIIRDPLKNCYMFVNQLYCCLVSPF